MPVIALILLNLAFGFGLAYRCATELRSTIRGPWNTLAARALAVHEVLIVFPLGAWWMLRAPDWSVSYLFHAARAPSLLLGLLVLVVSLVGFVGFAIGALAVRSHRAAVLPWTSAALVASTLVGAIVLRSRFSIVTSYVHFRGGLGAQPGLDVRGPDIFLLGIALWIGAGISLIFAASGTSGLPATAARKNSR